MPGPCRSSPRRGQRPAPRGLAGLLARFGHEVVAAVGDADGAARRRSPSTAGRGGDRRADAAGLHATRACRRRSRCAATDPRLPVLVLSQYVETTYAAELLDSGDGTGVGYLLKDRIGRGRASSSTRWTGWRPAARWSTRRWCGSCCAGAGTRSAADPARAGGAGADRRGPVERGDRAARWWSPRRRSPSTSAASCEARPAAGRRRPPPGAGGAGLPPRLSRTGPSPRRHFVNNPCHKTFMNVNI